MCVCVGAISAAELRASPWQCGSKDQLWLLYESRHGSTSPLHGTGLFARLPPALSPCKGSRAPHCLDLYAKREENKELKGQTFNVFAGELMMLEGCLKMLESSLHVISVQGRCVIRGHVCHPPPYPPTPPSTVLTCKRTLRCHCSVCNMWCQ